MAADCTFNGLAALSKCWTQLSASEKDAAIVYYMCQAVAACSSQTCTVDQLAADAACFKTLPLETIHAFEVAVAVQTAEAAGASVTGTLAELTAGFKCIRNMDDPTLRSLKLLLACKLNACL